MEIPVFCLPNVLGEEKVRKTSLAGFFSLLLFAAACKLEVPIPKTGPDKEKEKQTTEQKEVAKQKNSYLKKINSLEDSYQKLNSQMLEKRSRGYNTAEAEATLVLVEKSIAEAKDLVYWEKFDDLKLKIEEIKILEKKAKSLTKSAPEFGDRPVLKEKIQRKYGLDDREWVREIRGEPDKFNKHIRTPSRVTLRISNPTSMLTSSSCWSDFTQTFVIESPPNVESWYYPEDQMLYIFMETSPTVEQFLLRNDLPDSERDRLLAQLCVAPSYFGYKLIYADTPKTDVNQVTEQVFGGAYRSADMFGVGALDRLAKATAALPDLSVASVAFNTKIEPLNKLQKEQLDRFTELLKSLDPSAVSFMEESAKIRGSKEMDKAKDKKMQVLMDQQSAKTKKTLEAISRVSRWQRTFSPEQKDTDRLVKLFPEKEKEIKEVLGSFGKSLVSLSEEFENLRKELLKFKNTGYMELVFQKDQPPTTFFLLEGVRFEEKKLANKETVEIPDLTVKIIVELKLSKKEPPVLVKELPEFKITAANQFVNAVRDSRRLASFGLTFPATLSPGNYLITFLISDNLRVKTIKQKVNWVVVPD